MFNSLTEDFLTLTDEQKRVKLTEFYQHLTDMTVSEKTLAHTVDKLTETLENLPDDETREPVTWPDFMLSHHQFTPEELFTLLVSPCVADYETESARVKKWLPDGWNIRDVEEQWEENADWEYPPVPAQEHLTVVNMCHPYAVALLEHGWSPAQVHAPVVEIHAGGAYLLVFDRNILPLPVALFESAGEYRRIVWEISQHYPTLIPVRVVEWEKVPVKVRGLLVLHVLSSLGWQECAPVVDVLTQCGMGMVRVFDRVQSPLLICQCGLANWSSCAVWGRDVEVGL